MSTVGVPGKIRQLAADCPAANLALSLHAPMQENLWRVLRATEICWALFEDLRSTIVPSATSNKLDALLREARDLQQQRECN